MRAPYVGHIVANLPSRRPAGEASSGYDVGSMEDLFRPREHRTRSIATAARAIPWSALACALLALATGCEGLVVSSGSEPACAHSGYVLRTGPDREVPGKPFSLHGGGFVEDVCYDTGQGRPEPPDRNIKIEFRQAGKTWDLATVDARPKTYDFDVKLRVPPDARPGRAVVSAAGELGTPERKLLVLAKAGR